MQGIPLKRLSHEPLGENPHDPVNGPYSLFREAPQNRKPAEILNPCSGSGWEVLSLRLIQKANTSMKEVFLNPF